MNSDDLAPGELVNGEPWTELDQLIYQASIVWAQNRCERAQHIAAAVRAHLLSEAVVERVARDYFAADMNWELLCSDPTYAADDPDGNWTSADTYRAQARAALAAAIDAQKGEK